MIAEPHEPLIGHTTRPHPEDPKSWRNLPVELPAGTRLVLTDGTVCSLSTEGTFKSGTGTYVAWIRPETPLTVCVVFDAGRVCWEDLRMSCKARGEGKVEFMRVSCSYCGAAAGEPCVSKLPDKPVVLPEGHIRRQAEERQLQAADEDLFADEAPPQPPAAPLPDEDLMSLL